jgi:hypothetical protein
MIKNRDYQKEWYLKNKQRILEKKRKEYKENPELFKLKLRESYKKYKDKRAEVVKASRKLYPNRFKGYDLKKTFGITIEEYNLMLVDQNNSCYLCKTNKDQLKRNLAVDHCHKTGKIRKLLCEKCNVGLGSFKENIETLTNAIIYLKEQHGL